MLIGDILVRDMRDPAFRIFEWGPCMLALTEQQRRFVQAFFELRDATNAARLAGYKDGGTNAIRQKGYWLTHNQKIRDAIVEYAKVVNVGLIPKALLAREEIIDDRGHKDRAKVADTILATAGITQATEHKVTVEMTISEQFAELIRLGRKPEEVLANLPPEEKAKVLELVKGKDGSYGA